MELRDVIPHYQILLRDLDGCESGLDALKIDDSTVNEQTLQLLEQVSKTMEFLKAWFTLTHSNI